jgi:hypothetical protein
MNAAPAMAALRLLGAARDLMKNSRELRRHSGRSLHHISPRHLASGGEISGIPM